MCYTEAILLQKSPSHIQSGKQRVRKDKVKQINGKVMLGDNGEREKESKKDRETEN